MSNTNIKSFGFALNKLLMKLLLTTNTDIV